MHTKHKTITVTGIKTAGLAEGEFIGYASTFGNVDSQGDRVVRGAFAKSLAADNVVPILWEHKHDDPRMQVGQIKSARETDEGLEIHAALDLDTETGRAAYKSVRARRVKALSIGYGVRQAVKAADGANELRDLDLMEVSLVSRPANDRAEITASKSGVPERLVKARAEAAEFGGDDGKADDETEDLDLSLGERLVDYLERALASAKEIIDAAEADGRDLSEDEAEAVAKHHRNARITKTEIEEWRSYTPAQRLGLQFANDVVSTKAVSAEEFERRWGTEQNPAERLVKFDAAPRKTTTTAQEATMHDQTKFLNIGGAGRKSFAATIANKMAGGNADPAAAWRGEGGVGTKALTSSGQIITDIPIAPDVVPTGRPATSLLDVIPTVGRQHPIWRYLRQNSRALAAAPVAEGALKPTSAVGTETIDAEATVIAHLGEPVGKFILGDNAGLQRFVADELVYGLDKAVEAQVIAGDGVGPNLTGILSTSGVQVTPFTANVLTTLRKSLTAAELLGYAPSVAILRPEDWETIELTATSDESIAFRGIPIDLTERRVWGLRVVLSTHLPAKTALVLDPSAVSIDVVGPQIDIEWDSSGELFSHNQVQARVEGRFGVSVYQPAAIFKVATAA